MNEEAVKEIADLAARGVEIISVPGVNIASVPVGDGKVEIKSLKPFFDELLTTPERLKGTAKAATLASFIDLVNRHKDDGSAVFADLTSDAPKLTAVVDYHNLDHSPRFTQHRVEYVYPISDQWRAWRGKNGVSLSQLDFAAFIEDRVAELAAPLDAERAQIEPMFGTKFALPSEMIQLSRGLSLNVESKVANINVLRSGEAQIIYEEVHKDGTGQPLVVPGLFVINVPLFLGAEPTRLVARLRYRRDNGIKWSFHLWRWAETIRDSLLNDLDAVGKETSLPTFEGAPEA